MSAPILSKRFPYASTVAGRQQELLANIAVYQLVKDNWRRKEFEPKFGGRDKWFDGSAANQIYFRPVTLGISKRNILTLGAYFHRRDPVIAIHIFSRSANAVDQMTEEVDRILIDHGVNPQEGIQSILPAATPATAQDERDDEGNTLFHNILFTEVLYHKNRS